MMKEEVLELIDSHIKTLQDSVEVLKWTCLKSIILSISEDDWTYHLVQTLEHIYK